MPVHCPSGLCGAGVGAAEPSPCGSHRQCTHVPAGEQLLRLGPFQLSLEQRVPAPLRLLGDACRACSFAPRVFTDRSAGSRSFFPTARENRGLLSSALPCSR